MSILATLIIMAGSRFQLTCMLVENLAELFHHIAASAYIFGQAACKSLKLTLIPCTSTSPR